MSRALPGNFRTIQFQEESIFVRHELSFATARLLPVQAINYCHFKCITGIHGHTLTTSIVLLLSSFYFVSKSNVTCCPTRHQTGVCSEGEESGESAAVWVGRDRLHMERCGNSGRIPYCFPTCYLQRHKQILELYILILKCPAWNPLRAKYWCYQNHLRLCHDFTEASLHRIYQDDKTWGLDCFFPDALQTIFTVLVR